jgi:hypothetical protein
MAKTTYLQIQYGSGKLYEYSKEPKEGFESHENKDGEHKGFRRYLDEGLIGTYRGVGIREASIKGKPLKQVELTFQSGIDWYEVQINMFTQAGTFTDYAESLIRYLPNLKVGQKYRLWPWAMENEAGYMNYGVSFRHNDGNGEKVDKALFYQKSGEPVSPNAIPQIVWEDSPTGGKRRNQASVDANVMFLYKNLTEAVAATSEGTPGGNETRQATASFPDPPTTPLADDSAPLIADDDLPF